jgi:hypothetical protein
MHKYGLRERRFSYAPVYEPDTVGSISAPQLTR